MSTTMNAKLKDITIVSGQAASRVINSHHETSDAVGIVLMGPAALDAHAFEFECADDEAFTNPRTIMEGSPPAALTPPAVDEGRSYFTLPLYPFWRIKDTSSTVTADSIWKAWKVYRT